MAHLGRVALLALILASPLAAQQAPRPRARDAGVVVGVLQPGPLNAITDVAGVRVGQVTVAAGDSVNTGVTAILPHAGNLFREKVPAAISVGNGFGKLTGIAQVRELGYLETPIALTNTLDVPTAGAGGVADLAVEGLDPSGSCPGCLFEPHTFVRSRGAPRSLTIGFLATAGQSYVVDLDDLGSQGADATVTLNGQVIQDDVEIGANTTIDRATLGETRIGRGTKIDNLVQIAHNVQVGPLSILASQVGISGSTKMGVGVVAWGQAGIVGHLTIGDRAEIVAQAGVTQDVEPGARVAGSPARPDVQWARNSVAFDRLAEMRRELRELRKEVERLRAAREGTGS